LYITHYFYYFVSPRVENSSSGPREVNDKLWLSVVIYVSYVSMSWNKHYAKVEVLRPYELSSSI
jgi:hypothetical protein